MSEILDKIQHEIDKAVKKREHYKTLVNGKVDLLNKLRTQVQECIQKVSASSFENKAIYKEKLNQAKESIDQILKDSAPLINRFNRDTINLGVAGATQAGKSTLLEAISGVQLPRAKGERSGDSTTAAKSIIINSVEKRTTVYFRTKQEFVRLVQAYLPAKYKDSISEVEDFETLPLDTIKEDASISSSERYEITLLKDAQDSFHCFKHLLNSGQKDIDIADLADYVTFYQCKEPKKEHRFWAAVKLVEIRCPFTALNDSNIKLSLIDLPGMGQCPRVNKQMVDELENEVDTVMLLFKTTAVKPDDDAHTFDAIKKAQKFVNDKTKFLSFLINVVENDENRDGNINSIKIRIDDVFKRNNENYTTIETSIINSDKSFNHTKVHQDVVNVLTKLVGDIDALDSDTYNGWISQLDVTDLKKQVNEIANQIKDDLPYSTDDEKEFRDKSVEMEEDKLPQFNTLEEEYEVPMIINGIRKTINAEVQKIYDKIANSPLNNPNWDADFSKQREKVKGTDILTKELGRLWTYIRREYSAIENIADVMLTNLKNDIIDKFNKIVGGEKDFITKRGDEGIIEILEKISAKGVSMPFFTLAFESLLNERICFNQIVYPYIVESKLAKSISNDSRVGGLISDDSFKALEGESKEDERKHFKDKLIQVVLGVNGEMLSLICDKTPFAIAAFLSAKMTYFNDCLNRTTFDAKVRLDCFYNFCKEFRLELWPERFGSSSEAVVVRELTQHLNEISKLIDQLNK